MVNSSFTIRVYGLLLYQQQVLVADEIIAGKLITKFPGGGLEFGEGSRDCLKREMKEETGLDVMVGDHFYTTDFFQQSAFHRHPLQVMSIYYKLSLINDVDLSQLSAPSDDDAIKGFRLLPLSELSPAQLSLPIDKVVVNLLLQSE
jgi:8-oxo-dGTP diphosphatase